MAITVSIEGTLEYAGGRPYLWCGTLHLPLRDVPKRGVSGRRLWTLEVPRGNRWKVVRKSKEIK